MEIEKGVAIGAINVDHPSLARDYKYVDAAGAQVGMAVISSTDAAHDRIIVHFAKPQFLPDTSKPGLNARVAHSVLASIEMDVEAARMLAKLLSDMLPKE